MPALKNLLHERFAQAYPGCKLRKMSLGDIYLEAGGVAKNAHSAGPAGLTLEQWNTAARAEGIGEKRKADLTDIRNSLLSKGLIRQLGERWTVRHDGS